jgi:hypothetical protein
MTRELIAQGSNSCEDYEWNNICHRIEKLMDQLDNLTGRWHCELTGFGWRGTSGHKTFEGTTGQDLLFAILPHTDCSFKVYFDKAKGEIVIDNAHHDKPMGGEIYTITVVKPEDEEEDE